MGLSGPVGIVFVILLVLLIFILLPLLIVYILEEVRGSRSGERDEKLGVKILMLALGSLGFQLLIIGAGILLSGVADGGTDMASTGLGIGLGSVISMVLPLKIYTASGGTLKPDDRLTNKARGINAIFIGTMYVLTVIALVVVLVEGGDIAPPLMFTFVYLGGLLLCVSPWFKMGEGGGGRWSDVAVEPDDLSPDVPQDMSYDQLKAAVQEAHAASESDSESEPETSA